MVIAHPTSTGGWTDNLAANTNRSFGAPLAAKGIDDFAKDHAGTEAAFGHIVCVGHAAVGDEDERMLRLAAMRLRSLRPGSVPGLIRGSGPPP
jgi:hypothetical protein